MQPVTSAIEPTTVICSRFPRLEASIAHLFSPNGLGGPRRVDLKRRLFWLRLAMTVLYEAYLAKVTHDFAFVPDVPMTVALALFPICRLNRGQNYRYLVSVDQLIAKGGTVSF